MTGTNETQESEVLCAAMEELTRNRPWLLLVSFGIYFLAGVTLVIGILDIARCGPPEKYGSAPASSAVIVTLLTVFVYVVPAVLLHRFARSISNLQVHPTKENLLETLGHSTRFWRLAAIMLAIPIVIVLLALPGSF